jgi:hypothetical protein
MARSMAKKGRKYHSGTMSGCVLSGSAGSWLFKRWETGAASKHSKPSF